MIKILKLSDVHLEFSELILDRNRYADVDIVVLAGDIGLNQSVFEWVNKNFYDLPVIYIAGNHEFYGHSMMNRYRKLHEWAESYDNVYFLQNETLELCLHGKNYTFIAATFWTDFKLSGDTSLAMINAEVSLNDYRKIRYADGSKLTPKLILNEHNISRTFIESELSKNTDSTKIVITHHAPHSKSINLDRYGNDFHMHAAYASDLSNMILDYNPALWIHGHTHAPSDYEIGNTRIVSNPRGYVYKDWSGNLITENPNYDPYKIIEVN